LVRIQLKYYSAKVCIIQQKAKMQGNTAIEASRAQKEIAPILSVRSLTSQH
jgi:hypothetical protein